MKIKEGMRFRVVKTGAVFTVTGFDVLLDLDRALCYTRICGHWHDGSENQFTGAAFASDVARGLLERL